MAYVESFYLAADMEYETQAEAVQNDEINQQKLDLAAPKDEFEAFVLADHPLNFDAIQRIVAVQEAEERAKRVEIQVYSDYCGFESEDLPPVYREQLRQTQKAQINETELMTLRTVQEASIPKSSDYKNPNDHGMNVSIIDNDSYFARPTKLKEASSGGSKYAWEEPEANVKTSTSQHNTNLYTNDYNTADLVSVHDYVPGFSPPEHNELVHRRRDFALPRGGFAATTENVYHRTHGAGWVKNSQPASPVSYTGSLATSSMVSTIDNTSSVHTATQGPAYGALKSMHDKQKGIGAFKPVGETIESQYAYPGLN